MRALPLIAGLLGLAVTALVAAPAVDAQLCPDPSDTFWKNDGLNDAPIAYPAGAKVLKAACNDDAAGTYFLLPPGSAPQHVKQVSVGFGHISNEQFHQAILNVEVYQGSVGFNPGGLITMGTKVFDLLEDTGTTFDVFSTGMSSLDISEHNVVVSDHFVVAFRMLQNVSFPGCPSAAIGSDANFLVDGYDCNPGINVLDERNVGWVDPADWQWQFGQTICPQFYGGNWAIRACTTDAGTWTDQGNALAGSNGLPLAVGSGPLTAGSLNPITLSNALPSGDTFLIFGITSINAPFKGGVLVPTPDLILGPVPTDATGGWTLSSPWPAGVPGGVDTFWQVWIPDAGAVNNFASTNGLKATTP